VKFTVGGGSGVGEGDGLAIGAAEADAELLMEGLGAAVLAEPLPPVNAYDTAIASTTPSAPAPVNHTHEGTRRRV
jgi:hypothetical protein